MTDTPRLPDQAIEECREMIAHADGMQFGMGDWLVILVDEIGPQWKGAGVRHPRAAIIRQLAGATGADISTLKDRELMSRFYPASVRAEFDMLTYHQLRACKYAGERWREYAEWARGNLPAPVAAIRQVITHNGHLPPAWVSRWERVTVLCDQLANDEAAPAKIRLACSALLASCPGPVEQPGPGQSVPHPTR